MLQQTTVAAVIPYFERFLAAFPTVADLAAASEERVLRLWEGLGYYSRARNLHRAAQRIVAEHGGELPRDVVALQALPGIGRYTAGAIASFAYNLPAPIVEANTLRLYSRLINYGDDPRSAAGQQVLWAFAGELLSRASPGDFNQALMDLGATVCVPDEPRCEACPVASLCGAFAAGIQREIPRSAKRPEFADVTECAVVIERRGKFLLRRCQPGERWAGLWDFPRFAVSPTKPTGQELSQADHSPPGWLIAAAADGTEQLTGLRPVITGGLGQLRHGVTRYRITLWCLRGETDVSPVQTPSAECRWTRRSELPDLPLSTTGREIVRRWIEDESG
jgi:A/G-specific adenine glycosylase